MMQIKGDNNMIGYNFIRSNIGDDGIGYFTFDLEPTNLDARDLIHDVRAVDFTHDHKKQKTTISTFVWKHGAPSDWEEIKTVKGEIIEECEVPNWLEKLGLKIK